MISNFIKLLPERRVGIFSRISIESYHKTEFGAFENVLILVPQFMSYCTDVFLSVKLQITYALKVPLNLNL